MCIRDRSNNAHSHLSRSPQYGQTQIHCSMGFSHSEQFRSSSEEDNISSSIKYYKWFDHTFNEKTFQCVSYKTAT